MGKKEGREAHKAASSAPLGTVRAALLPKSGARAPNPRLVEH